MKETVLLDGFGRYWVYTRHLGYRGEFTMSDRFVRTLQSRGTYIMVRASHATGKD
jgi:hypothetical protein